MLLQESVLVCGGCAGTLAVLTVDTDLAADPKSLKKFPTGLPADVYCLLH